LGLWHWSAAVVTVNSKIYIPRYSSLMGSFTSNLWVIYISSHFMVSSKFKKMKKILFVLWLVGFMGAAQAPLLPVTPNQKATVAYPHSVTIQTGNFSTVTTNTQFIQAVPFSFSFPEALSKRDGTIVRLPKLTCPQIGSFYWVPLILNPLDTICK